MITRTMQIFCCCRCYQCQCFMLLIRAWFHRSVSVLDYHKHQVLSYIQYHQLLVLLRKIYVNNFAAHRRVYYTPVCSCIFLSWYWVLRLMHICQQFRWLLKYHRLTLNYCYQMMLILVSVINQMYLFYLELVHWLLVCNNLIYLW